MDNWNIKGRNIGEGEECKLNIRNIKKAGECKIDCWNVRNYILCHNL
jgi:hypothetical protein